MEEEKRQESPDPKLDLNFNSQGKPGDLAQTSRIKERFIWLEDDVWEDLDWTEDGPQDFMNKVLEKEVFDQDDMPPPFHGDVIAGRDKYEKIIVFKLLLVEDSVRFGQKENNW
jgi:hypothetical protein